MLVKFEHFLYRSAKSIIFVTNSFKDGLISYGISSEKIKVIKNGVNTSDYKPVDKDFELVNELGLRGKFVIGYIGTHGMAHALDFILSCTLEIEDSNNVIIL